MDLDETGTDSEAWTPLFMAAENGHAEVAEALIKARCEVDKASNEGMTPLSTAAENGHAEVAEALIEAGCDVDKADKDGHTPLYMAAEHGHAEVVEALLRAGCDTSAIQSIPSLIVGPFVAHYEEQQNKMLALAGGLHRRLGAESVVMRLDDNLLQMIWKPVEKRCIVPPVEEAVDPSEVDEGDGDWDDAEDWDHWEDDEEEEDDDEDDALGAEDEEEDEEEYEEEDEDWDDGEEGGGGG